MYVQSAAKSSPYGFFADFSVTAWNFSTKLCKFIHLYYVRLH